jgi:hypothetical protein
MPWNSTAPLGSVSVKANRTILQQNTTYIETTMGNSVVGTNTVATRDHFWNVGSNEDGRHRFIQSQAFTVGGNPADPVIGTGMDSVLYAKTTNGRVEWFHRNAAGIYQFIPSYKTGTVNITSAATYVTVTDIPANCWGQIFFFLDATPNISSSGVVSSNGTITKGWSTRVRSDSSGLDEYALELRNNGAVDLNIFVRRGDSSSSFNGIWRYRLMYWAF